MSWTWVTKHGMYSATKQVVDNSTYALAPH